MHLHDIALCIDCERTFNRTNMSPCPYCASNQSHSLRDWLGTGLETVVGLTREEIKRNKTLANAYDYVLWLNGGVKKMYPLDD